MAKPAQGWYRLDNAGMVYSAIQRDDYSAVYRFSVVMDAPVDPQRLQKAADRVMPRFPGLQVRLRRGVFWYYFDADPSFLPQVEPDIANPCQPIRFSSRDRLLRIFYYESRISIELFHALADGAGALVFLKTLTAEYLRQTGVEVPCTDGVLDPAQPPDLHVGAPDAVLRFVRHPVTPIQDAVLKISLHSQNPTPWEIVGQGHRVRGKGQHLPVQPGPDAEPQRLPRVVEGGKGQYVHGSHGKLPLRLHFYGQPQQFLRKLQGGGSPLGQIHAHPVFDHLVHGLGMVLVLVADQAGVKGRQPESAAFLELSVGEPAIKKNAGLVVTDDVGVPVGGTG